MKPLWDVVEVRPLPPWRLWLRFDNGETRLFDMTPLLDRAPFQRLRSPGVFEAAHVAWGTVAWPGNLDIAPETLYELSVPAPSDAAVTDNTPAS